MFKVTVNKKNTYHISNEKNTWNVGKKKVTPDITQVSENAFHLILEGLSYRISFQPGDMGKKEVTVYVNNNRYTMLIQDKYDQLLRDLGIEDMQGKNSGPVKSPMPGKVLEVNVNPGDEVKAGDALLILEAMKMENVIKAPADGTVKEVNVQKGQSVEKNHALVLIS